MFIISLYCYTLFYCLCCIVAVEPYAHHQKASPAHSVFQALGALPSHLAVLNIWITLLSFLIMREFTIICVVAGHFFSSLERFQNFHFSDTYSCLHVLQVYDISLCLYCTHLFEIHSRCSSQQHTHTHKKKKEKAPLHRRQHLERCDSCVCWRAGANGLAVVGSYLEWEHHPIWRVQLWTRKLINQFPSVFKWLGSWTNPPCDKIEISLTPDQ